MHEERTMDTNEILTVLRELKEEIRVKYKATNLALFGSSVRHDQTVTSDIDILADFGEHASMFDLAGLGLFLEDEFQREVDIVPRESLRPEIRETVLRESIPV